MPSAADILNAKTPLPVRMTSEQWARMSPEITVRSIFGALVDELSVLLKTRQQAAAILKGVTSKTETRHALTDMLDAIGYTPEPAARPARPDRRPDGRPRHVGRGYTHIRR